MKVLVGCEESQTVTQAFLALGHEAYSCDILPTRGDPKFHFQADIKRVIPLDFWDLIILHPDCTAMALSGNRWYGRGMPMHQKRLDAIAWTLDLCELAKKHSSKVFLENPMSVIFSYLTDVQYIHPLQFGHGEKKCTGFALHSLPRLVPTNVVDGREERIWRMPPSATRKRDRSATFPGVASALALQWGRL